MANTVGSGANDFGAGLGLGVAQLVLQVEDSQLLDALRLDEQLVRESVSKIQDGFDKVATATGKAGKSAMSGVQSFRLIGQASRLAGLDMLAYSSGVGRVIFMLEALVPAELSATAATAGLAAAARSLWVAFAPLVGVTVALAPALIIWAYKNREAKEEIDRLNESIKNSDDIAAKAAASYNEFGTKLEALQKAGFMARGGAESGWLESQRGTGVVGLEKLIEAQKVLETLQANIIIERSHEKVAIDRINEGTARHLEQEKEKKRLLEEQSELRSKELQADTARINKRVEERRLRQEEKEKVFGDEARRRTDVFSGLTGFRNVQDSIQALREKQTTDRAELLQLRDMLSKGRITPQEALTIGRFPEARPSGFAQVDTGRILFGGAGQKQEVEDKTVAGVLKSIDVGIKNLKSGGVAVYGP